MLNFIKSRMLNFIKSRMLNFIKSRMDERQRNRGTVS